MTTPGRQAAIEAAAKAILSVGMEAGAAVVSRSEDCARAAIVAYERVLAEQPREEHSNLADVFGRATDARIGLRRTDVQRRQDEAEQPREERDDARHITWDHGRRTLCGQAVDGDPGDFYLPLGKAPRHDEGGAWCWSCLQLQDEAAALTTERHRTQELRYTLKAIAFAASKFKQTGSQADSWEDIESIARSALAASQEET